MGFDEFWASIGDREFSEEGSFFDERVLPGWMVDRFISMRHFRESNKSWEIFDTTINETVQWGRPHEPLGFYFLSLLVHADSQRMLEADFGSGKFVRPSQPGSMVLGNKYMPDRCEGVGPFHVIGIYFDEEWFTDRLSEIAGKKVDELDVLHSRYFRDEGLEILIHQLLGSYRGIPGPEIQLQRDQLGDSICRRLLFLGGEKVSSVHPDDTLKPVAVEKTISYMRVNLHRALDLKELAGIANVSPGHFARLFRQTMGVTPVRYMRGLRIEEAKRLLRYQKSVSVKEVSISCGFLNQGHFSVEFRRQVGTSPGEYRRFFGGS